MAANRIDNPPGLGVIAFRTGTWRDFRESLVARLSSGDLEAVAGLKAREDDFTLALIDAFAVMADVLTFYQERYANEAFLPTATERRSVLELAALLGYVPAPGVAADAWLAFTLQDAPGAPAQASLPVTIPAGTRVQSVPGPDESAQTFETVGAAGGRVEHNAIGVRTRVPQEIAFGRRELYLAGTTRRLAPGDAILVVGSERAKSADADAWDVRLLSEVEPDDARGHTRIAWREGLGEADPRVEPAQEDVEVHVFRRHAALFGHNAPDARLLSTNGTRLSELANLDTGEWNDFGLSGRTVDLDQPYERVVPGSWLALSDETVAGRRRPEPGSVALYRAESVTQRSRSAFGLSSRVTRVELDSSEHVASFDRRTTLVLAESERLPLAERPVRAPLLGVAVALADRREALAPGQPIAVSGHRQHVRVRPEAKDLSLLLADGTRVALGGDDRLALVSAPVRSLAGGALQALDGEQLAAAVEARDAALLTWSVLDRDGRGATLACAAAALDLDSPATGDPRVAEIARVADAADGVTHDRDRTHLRLAVALRHVYAPETVSINANVAPATHGESVSEILGSGDASRPDQRFPLKQLPLTHVRAETPSGRRSTLAVRVSEALWEERRTLYGAGPLDRLHTTETGDDLRTSVVFGDGTEGARLPTGDHNVRASYRKGLGAAGNVRAGALTTLLSAPLGVAGVINIEPATGGEDAEALGAARENAPLTVLTLDRAVSLRDYEDFARGFAGIAKAHATWVATGPSRGVLLTVAGPEGASVESSQPTHASLVGALRRFGDQLVRTTVASYRPANFRLGAAVKVAGDAESATVLAGVRAALLAAFSFGARGFGQTVSIDEVAAVIHRVRGVVAVDVNALRRSDQASTPAVRPRLFAALATVTAAGVAPAELLTLAAAALELEVLA